VERLHVVGSNDEPCCISGSICAERAALLQLRFIPHMKRISKVVISTDALHPLYPGMLCREFLSSHPHTHPDLRIVMAGSKCANCLLDIRAGQQRDISKLEAPCTNSSTHHHDWAPIETTLADIYPHPSPYTRLTASEACRMGEQFADANTEEISDERIETPPSSNTNLSQEELSVENRNEKLLGQAILASQHDNRTDLHPIRYGAAVLFSDGTISTAHQKKALEYGCSLDAVTQLVPSIDKKAKQESPIYPTLLIQADQFGIVHPPFAVARAFLSEHGYENCGILVHNTFDTHNFLKVVRVKDLAPSAPDMGALWED